MATKIIEVGDKFGNWTVKGLDENTKKYNYDYICECKCGYRRTIRKDKLLLAKYPKCPKCSENACNIPNEQMNQEIIQRLLEGQGATEIARDLGATRDKVRYIQYIYKEDLESVKKKNDKEDEILKSKIEEKLHCKTKKQISEETDIPIYIVARIFKKYNLELYGTGICKNCGKKYDYSGNRGRTQQYCSDKCRDLYKIKKSVTICKICGRIIIGTGKEFCSEQCRNKRKRKCVICGTIFYGFHTSKTCSDECKKELKKSYHNKIVKRKCAICGTEFECKKHSSKTTCSVYCKNIKTSNKVDSTLLELFGTTSKTKIRKIVKRCLNEKKYKNR